MKYGDVSVLEGIHNNINLVREYYLVLVFLVIVIIGSKMVQETTHKTMEFE